MKTINSRVVLLTLCMVLVKGVACGAVTVVEREAFWFTPPKADPQTVALWTFDGGEGGGG